MRIILGNIEILSDFGLNPGCVLYLGAYYIRKNDGNKGKAGFNVPGHSCYDFLKKFCPDSCPGCILETVHFTAFKFYVKVQYIVKVCNVTLFFQNVKNVFVLWFFFSFFCQDSCPSCISKTTRHIFFKFHMRVQYIWMLLCNVAYFIRYLIIHILLRFLKESLLVVSFTGDIDVLTSSLCLSHLWTERNPTLSKCWTLYIAFLY